MYNRLLLFIIFIIIFIFYFKNKYITNEKFISNVSIPYIILDKTKQNIFNMSYCILKNKNKNNNKTITIYGIGRCKNDHGKLVTKLITLKNNKILNKSKIETFNIPKEVKDNNVGEVKQYIINGKHYIYSYFFGNKLNNLSIFPNNISDNAKKLYFKSKYKNYLINITDNKIIPLFYDILPGSNNTQFTNKNFLLFKDIKNIGQYKLITCITPHKIFKLDISTGYMNLYSETHNNIASYFDKEQELCLSGGPIYLGDKYLVAGHIRKGGWGGLRQTFFYTFNANYPNNILEISPLVNFGFSKKLEYCNNISKYNNNILISLGIEDDYSNLLKTNINNILKLLIPI